MTAVNVFVVVALVLAPQEPPASTGVPECDRYVAMVRACLPRMCEDERILREMELGFALETIAAAVTHRGRASAAESCSRDVAAELRDDLYACHPESPSSKTRVELMPAGNAVQMRFSSQSLAEGADVSIAEPLAEAAAVYRIAASGGHFLLDTRKTPPLPPGNGPLRLEPETPYCYAISTPGADPSQRRILRKGVFVTKAP